MDFLEKDLEDIIYETPHRLLRERGLDIDYGIGHRKRQLRLFNGVADIVTFKRYKNGVRIQVIELKKDTIGMDTFEQALNYAIDINNYLRYNKGVRFNYWIEIVLIGRRLKSNDNIKYLSNLLNVGSLSMSAYTYDYNFDGIQFDKH